MSFKIHTNYSISFVCGSLMATPSKCQMWISKLIIFVNILLEPLLNHFSFVLLNLQIGLWTSISFHLKK